MLGNAWQYKDWDRREGNVSKDQGPNLTQRLKGRVIQQLGQTLASLGFTPDVPDGVFYSYRRLRRDFVDLVEVQFNKTNRPKFVVNFGTAPREGIIDAYGRAIATDELRVSHLEWSGRLYRWPWLIRWFGIGPMFSAGDGGAALERCAARALRLLPKVERWFQTGQRGPYLRIHRHPENAPGARKDRMQADGKWPPEGWTREDEEAVLRAARLRTARPSGAISQS